MASMTIELQPFTVPNYVIQKVPPTTREQGPVEAPKHALADLSPDALDALCDEFRTAVFAKAQKKDPRRFAVAG